VDRIAVERALNDVLVAGPIQILVSNAGVYDDAPLAGMRPEQWHRVIDVSLHGFYNVCRPLLLPMIGTRWGRVVAVSSIAGQLGNPGQANYAAAKAGLHGAVKSLAREVASRGITANVVAPGIVAGGMTDDVFDQGFIDRTVPAKRAGRPEEVAALIAFLASGNAGYISGQVIGVNGGIS
jgi:3-oxoacyl-[acyl-carrier protein] reductase